MHKAILLLLSAGLTLAPPLSAWADVPVIDDDAKKKRSEEEKPFGNRQRHAGRPARGADRHQLQHLAEGKEPAFVSIAGAGSE
ncbi:hypothetical protein U8C32_25980 (plasmid) [Sinorhizobium medicae]|uniref:hypothetical protein n=1 Tax=Sinorhizobium medicae TaxID=110321 RepID=UPI002AF6BDB7|nr:hypothetical protein [Sinorhizobium medicae]WQO95003.1 hypothetical protein U8C32_25980 [Sinorhizobium medicae]